MDSPPEDIVDQVIDLLEPLTRQGEDYIWRPVAKAVELLRPLRATKGKATARELAEFQLHQVILRMALRVEGGRENVAIGQHFAKEIVAACAAARAVLATRLDQQA